jgi:T5SS/PEP-CTERM-associated repeat protein
MYADYLYVSQNSAIFSMDESEVNVSAGGHLVSPLSIVGGAGIGRVHVDGSGSSWTGNDQMFVGLNGHGQVIVTGGARVDSGLVQLGINFGRMGQVSVNGAGSLWQSTQAMYVGVAGSGELSVTGGGGVTVGGGPGMPKGPLSVGSRGRVQGNS